ncbi:aminotransferase class IV [Candidatus Poribacteria bacterium]|nr:aminotransferase class IV [Candidatus Poribacteria bacterium]
MNTVCLNGEFHDFDGARIPASDAGFLLGDGLFETMRAEEGHVLHADEHFARLARGARVLEIPYRVRTEDLLALCQQVLDANHLQQARVRLTLTRGPVRGLPAAADEGEPVLLITATRLDNTLERDRREGWRAMLAPFPRNHRSPLASIKATSYLEPLLGRRYAARHGFHEALFLNTDGRLAEGAMTNLFLVRGGTVMTPPVAEGALPGIMRQLTIRACETAGIPFEESRLSAEDLVGSDEAFVTNAIIELMPLVQFGERGLSGGQPGEMTRRLHEEHRREVEAVLDGFRR